MADIVRDTIAALIAAETQRIVPPSPPFGFGVDLICVGDIDRNMRETDPDSVQSLAQDLFHRLTTPRGQLDDDPNFGFDVRGLLSVGLTANYVRSLEGQISGELQKDDRVASAACTLSQSGSLTAPAYRLFVDVTPDDPRIKPFKLIMSVADGEALLKEILQPSP